MAVARLKAAGFIPVGRTNMTEFAFSGLGINPHYGTPRNTYDRSTGRIPGGSSPGAAVSVTDGMAYAALDAVLSGEPRSDLTPFPLDGLRLAVPQTLVFDGIDATVAAAFAAAQSCLSQAGVKIVDIPLRELGELAQINRLGGFGAPESYAYHRSLIEQKHDQYDPSVVSRILRGREQSATDYIDLLAARADFIRRTATIMAPYDALLMPTVPLIAPPLRELDSDDVYRDVNLLMLRNPTIANFIGGCSISIPCHHAGDAPVGLMLISPRNGDARLLAIAAAIEALVSSTAS